MGSALHERCCIGPLKRSRAVPPEWLHGLQGSTQRHCRFPSSGLEQGYVYLMTHPGTPSVFYDHLEEPQLARTIQRLIALRLRAGVHCRSQVRSPSQCLGN